MVMKKYIIFILLLLYKSAVAQTTNDYTASMPVIIPHTPQAAAFARYGEYPVNMATGVPQIDIPLYEINTGDISIPISISYHASGIKVEDVATPVGLGWVLNTGGVITRAIYGSADDQGYTNNTVKSVQDLREFLKKNTDVAVWKSFFGSLIPKNTQSDRYIYNFNGKTGVFRYNSLNSEIITVPYAPLKIEATANGFKIKDTDGLVYYFETPEYSGPSYYAPRTAWYVTKIESQFTGSSVNYKYNRGSGYSGESTTNQILSKGTEYEWGGSAGPL
jgi:hypothetical protein